jgi:hypothetical protein
VKLTIISEDKKFLQKWNFFEFLKHENIKYEIDAVNIDTDYMLCLYYVVDGWPCEYLQLLEQEIDGSSGVNEAIKNIPKGAIFCFHGLDKLDQYSEYQKKVCMELIEKLREQGNLYYTHIFGLMQMLRVEKARLIDAKLYASTITATENN